MDDEVFVIVTKVLNSEELTDKDLGKLRNGIEEIRDKMNKHLGIFTNIAMKRMHFAFSS